MSAELARRLGRQRRTDFTADVKAFAVKRYAECNDATQAADEAESHFARQHKAKRLRPSPALIVRWAAAGAGDPQRFRTNSRGGHMKAGSDCAPS